MKKQHVRMINMCAIGVILGVCISAFLVSIFDTDSAQADSAQVESETQITSQSEAEEASSTELTDAEYIKAMPEREQAHLIAIVCLATEQGNSPSEVAASIANNFDAISEDYAQSFVSAALITVCNQASE